MLLAPVQQVQKQTLAYAGLPVLPATSASATRPGLAVDNAAASASAVALLVMVARQRSLPCQVGINIKSMCRIAMASAATQACESWT